MQYLNQGYQYKVYDLGNGRVLKKQQSYFYTFRKTMEVAKKQEGKGLLGQILIALKSAQSNKVAMQKIREKLNEIPLDIFANPEFIGGSFDFTQDKVLIIEEYLKDATLDQKKEALDGYLDLQKTLWKYGVHDAVYKFQPNYGLNKEGRVVCIDFGEFMFEKEEIIKSINTQKWLSRPSYKKWDDDLFKRYYTQRMAVVISERSFLMNWQQLLSKNHANISK